jgi:hypothetical protein
MTGDEQMTQATLIASPLQLPRRYPRGFLLLAAVLWWLLYQALAPASEALVAALPVDRASHLGGALQFFLYGRREWLRWTWSA